MRILLVEDDESIVELLTAVLVGQSYVVDVATDGEAGWEMVEAFPYDLVVLDIMLPRLDGISFCRRLRDRNNPVLVMMLTARDTTTDKLLGLDSGADDYVIKPFNSQELIARVRALLRRGNTTLSSILECGGLRLDPNTRNVTFDGMLLQFSRKEYLLLELFLRNPHRVFSRRAIVEHLWAFDEEAPIEDTVKSHIKNIRKELRRVGAGDLIETLYGQGYRINPLHFSRANSSETTPTAQQETLDATVAQIWERKKGSCLERLAVLEQVVQAIKTHNLDANLHQKAIENAHKLAGGLGTFGLDEGSRLARQIEESLEAHLAESQTTTPQHLKRTVKPLEQLVVELRQVIQNQQNQRTATVELKPTSLALPARPQPTLLVFDRDRSFTSTLVIEAISWNIQVVDALDLDEICIQLQTITANLILLELDFLQNTDQGFLLSAFKKYAPTTPIVVISAQDRSIDRLAAVQLGAAMFLAKSTPLPQMLQAMMQLLQELNWGVAKVLIVEQASQTVRQLRTSALPQPLQLTELSEPGEFWETLKSVHPDLLILDEQLPDGGLSLCRSVRQDPYWNWLPIIVLAKDATPSTLHEIFAAGADDYIAQPLVPETVAIQIVNRVRRSRLLRNQAQVDELTDLSNRHQSIQGLNQLLKIAQRSQQPVCFAILDLDHFKQINDEYGHGQGDRVLRQFGQFLKQKFRAGDVVARWGGEEFVIGMYGITWGDGVERLAEILEEWRSIPLAASPDKLNVSFSAGVAQYPNDGINVQMLYRSADAALYRAKVAGRNRVLSSQWQPVSGAAHADVVLLYPEDEFAHDLLNALETRGYHTCWFKQGKEALKRFRSKRFIFNPPIILLSDSLSDLSWQDLIRRLGTKQRQQTQVILLLNQADTVGKKQTDLLFDYLLVPCSTSVVTQRLRQALGRLGLHQLH